MHAGSARSKLGNAPRSLGNTWSVALCAVLLLGAGVLPSAADQTDPRLPDLFERLQSGTASHNASFIEQEIWQIWMTGPEPAASEQLQAARAAVAAGHYAAAEETLNTLVEGQPNFAEAWNQRALLRFLREDYASSLLDIERTLALEPRHFGALAGQGQCLLHLNKPEAALAAFEAALAVHPWLPDVQIQTEMLRAYLNGRDTPI